MKEHVSSVSIAMSHPVLWHVSSVSAAMSHPVLSFLYFISFNRTFCLPTMFNTNNLFDAQVLYNFLWLKAAIECRWHMAF